MIFIVLQVYPFGSRYITNLDLYHQYMPIMSELQRIIHEGGNIFYSFNGGLGTNFFSLSTYQNASPITWIFLAIFSEEKIALCVTFMVLFKIGLISVTMYWYLREFVPAKDNCSRPSVIKLMLAVTFALSGYVIAYYTNVMWLDSIILLPLCIGGLRRVVEKKGSKLYVISLALLLFTNYYIGALVCIFLILYYLMFFVSEGKKQFIRSSIRLLAHSALSILMAMVVLLPTFFALKKTEDYMGIRGQAEEGLFHTDIPTHLTQLLPNSSVTVVEGPPNLYAGLITLLLLALFFMSREITLRKRLMRMTLLLFLFVSTNFIPLDTFLHFFHMPNGFPARYSFVLSFLMIDTAAELPICSKGQSRKKVLAAFGLIILLYGASFYASDLYELNHQFLLISGALLLMLYAMVIIIMRDETGRVRKSFLVVAILFEVVFCSFRGIGAGSLVKDSDYRPNSEDVSELVHIAEAEDPYARLELIGSDNEIPPYVYGYKGASLFASSAPGTTYQLLRCFLDGGLFETNSFRFRNNQPIGDNLMNLRYYIGMGITLKGEHIQEIARSGNCVLYKNTLPAAFAYMLPNDMTMPKVFKDRESFLNDFVDSATGIKEVITDGKVNEVKWHEAAGCLFADTMSVTAMRGNSIAGDIDVSKDGILLIAIPYDEGWQVRVDGQKIEDTQNIYSLVSFPLSVGEHHVEMTFIPRGFIAGAGISMLSLTLFILLVIKNKL